MNYDERWALEILIDIVRLFKTIFRTLCREKTSCGECKYSQICESINFIQDELYEIIGDD